jgi:Flp pilus assembly pilin Flp
MKNLFVTLWQEEKGQDLTEYALLLIMVSLASMAAMSSLGHLVSSVFSNASGSIS